MPQEESIRLQRRNLATAKVVLRFWSGQPYRFVWHRVLRHRFAPETVWLRYWNMKVKRLHDIAKLNGH